MISLNIGGRKPVQRATGETVRDERSGKNAVLKWLADNFIGLLIMIVLAFVAELWRENTGKQDAILKTLDTHSSALATVVERTTNLNTAVTQEREDRKSADQTLQYEIDDLRGVSHARR